MASSRYLITSTTLSTSAASVTFSSIPSTYTDLILKCSIRTDWGIAANDEMRFTLNSNSGGSDTVLVSQGNTASSTRYTGTGANWIGWVPDASSTSNTFGSYELYIPNYTSTINKQASVFGAGENNATTVSNGYIISAIASLIPLTSAVNSIYIGYSNGNNLVSGSSFYLYGIKNS